MKNSESIKTEIEEVLKKYKDDKSMFKDYSKSMKEMNLWLKELEK